jgi:hypothetical protein
MPAELTQPPVEFFDVLAVVIEVLSGHVSL